jgi:hypothetical protein
MPVVAVKPARQLSGAVFRSFVGCGVGPFAQAGLNEALGLSVGFGRVGPGPQVLDLEPAQGLGVALHAVESFGSISPDETEEIKRERSTALFAVIHVTDMVSDLKKAYDAGWSSAQSPS